jgi:hypothetical protein
MSRREQIALRRGEVHGEGGADDQKQQRTAKSDSRRSIHGA